MMKIPSIIFVGAVLILVSFKAIDLNSDSSDNKINWVTIEEAQELTKEEPRKVFIDIYADWCGWCKVMDRKTFTDKKVYTYINENYYAVRIDAESQNIITYNGRDLSEQDLVKSFKVQGLPTIVFIDEDFKKIKPVAGYQNADQFLKSLEKFNR